MPRAATSRSAKTRKAPARRAPQRRRQRRNDGLFRDVISIGLMAAGALGLVSLAFPGATGGAGRTLAGALHAFAGLGAFLIPLGILALGVLLVLDPGRIHLDEVTGGALLLSLSCISLLHVAGVPAGQGDNPVLRAQHGGLVGALLGGTLEGWVGTAGAYIILIALACLSLLLVVDVPLPDILRGAGRGASRGAEALRSAKGLRTGENNGRRAASKPTKTPFIEIDAPKTAEEPKEEPKKRGKKGVREAAPPSEPEGGTADAPESEPVIQPTLWSQRSAEEETSSEPEPAEPRRRGKAKLPAAEDTDYAPEAQEAAAPEPAQEPQPPKEYVPPPTSVLDYAQILPEGPGATSDTARNIKILEETLAQFRIEAKVVEIAQGPTFTRYEIRLAPGIRVNRIESLGDNIAMNLAALDVRIQAPIPGKAAIGIEVPNKAMAMVSLREVVEAPEFANATSRLTFALGKDVTGRAWTADLARMPHLLIGGATNSGKSVCLNCMIASILFRVRPDEVKFLLIDPKRVELSLFDGIPHLIYPVITDVKRAAGMLNWAIQEMERRYELFVKAGTRDINSYNVRAEQEGLEHLPYIIIVVDELADLMMQVAAEVEHAICRLAQLARATGIHLVIATQRPSVDVITGLIKANISSRIAFAVSSHIDSRTILDKRGAERLLGRGDMLFDPIGAAKPVRIQCAYISEKEVETLVEYLRRQAAPVYTAQPVDAPGAGGGPAGAGGEGDNTEDDLFEDAVRLVVTTRRASTSMLQRKFSIGYTRAARLVDMMEERGIVSALDGAKPREVLVSREQIEQFFRSPLNAPPDAPGEPAEDDYE